jgi:hypothetical protein
VTVEPGLLERPYAGRRALAAHWPVALADRRVTADLSRCCPTVRAVEGDEAQAWMWEDEPVTLVARSERYDASGARWTGLVVGACAVAGVGELEWRPVRLVLSARSRAQDISTPARVS